MDTANQPELLDAEPVKKTEKAVARRPRTTAIAKPFPAEGDQWLNMLERLVTNPDVDLTKLEKLIELKERTAKTDAEAQFNAAYALMQGELPIVVEYGKGERGERGGSYGYARFEDIVEVCRPIMARHGFGIRFEHTREGTLQVCTGILSHAAGHSISDRFEAAPDSGGNKPPIQANGSTRSYGERYTMKALLGVATKGQDDDGRSSQAREAPAAPKGFDEWWLSMEAVAEEGIEKLERTWKESAAVFRDYVFKHKAQDWVKLKAKAQKKVPRG